MHMHMHHLPGELLLLSRRRARQRRALKAAMPDLEELGLLGEKRLGEGEGEE